jgi:predicted deacylase
MRTIAIGEFSVAELPPGTSERVWIEVFPELLQPVRLPAFVVKGAKPGRTFFIVAGVHGDEYEGMEAIRRVVPKLDPAAMAGSLVAIPVANPFAYEARARIAPWHIDSLNLARVFPGDPAGMPSRRLAAALLDLVERNVGPDDLFLDFHSGSADVPYATLIAFRDVPGESTRKAEEAARHFGAYRIWRIPDSQGPFNAETARRRIPTIGTETTGRAGCLSADVAVYEQGLWNVLAYLGICPDRTVPTPLSVPSRSSHDIVAPATGFLRMQHQIDDEVAAGETIGQIVDVFGDPVADVVTPVSGIVWAARSMPPVRVGELIATIALT